MGGTISSPENHWDNRQDTYVRYPTVRHRHRLVLNEAHKVIAGKPGCLVFDYGCGVGLMLDALRAEALEVTRGKVPHCLRLTTEPLPVTGQLFDLIICIEVIEHIPDYQKSIDWISSHLRPGGTLVLTTQGGPRFDIDFYSGHTLHFSLGQLESVLGKNGMAVQKARAWGFPIFSAQKRVADLHFDGVRQNFLEAHPYWALEALFSFTYGAYFLHDLVPLGPQLIVVASKDA